MRSAGSAGIYVPFWTLIGGFGGGETDKHVVKKGHNPNQQVCGQAKKFTSVLYLKLVARLSYGCVCHHRFGTIVGLNFTA